MIIRAAYQVLHKHMQTNADILQHSIGVANRFFRSIIMGLVRYVRLSFKEKRNNMNAICACVCRLVDFVMEYVFCMFDIF